MTELHEEAAWPESLLEGESAEEVKRIIQALYRVHRLISAINDQAALLARITEESRRVAQAEASSLMLFDPDTEELYFHIALGESGDQEQLKREVRLKLGQGIAGATAAARTSIIVNDVRNDPRFYAAADAASGFQTRSLLAVPMTDGGELVGVLEVVNKNDGTAFTELDLRVMEMFSGLAASAVVNARLIEERIRNAQLAAIGQAVTTLSHHTKNIVTSLSSSAELIDMGLAGGNVDVLRRSWPVFRRSTKRISNFVQDMLSFSKPRQPLRKRCRVDAVANDAIETFRELFERKNIALETDIAGLEREAWLDEQSIYRCLLNLLTNAADAVDEGSGCVFVRGYFDDNNRIVMDVSDNGPGVPEADRERIFQPFFSTKGSAGTGLGLAVARKSAREHDGELSVTAGAEGGALFRLVLPADV